MVGTNLRQAIHPLGVDATRATRVNDARIGILDQFERFGSRIVGRTQDSQSLLG